MQGNVEGIRHNRQLYPLMKCTLKAAELRSSSRMFHFRKVVDKFLDVFGREISPNLELRTQSQNERNGKRTMDPAVSISCSSAMPSKKKDKSEDGLR